MPSAARLLSNPGLRGWLTISPPFLYALLLLAGPILVVIAHSFWTQDYLTVDRTFTLANYRMALTEPLYLDLLGRSLFVSAVVSVVTVLLAYPDRLFHLLSWRAEQGPVAFRDHGAVLVGLPAADPVVEGDPRL